MFVSLLIGAVSLGGLLHDWVDHAVSSASYTYSPYSFANWFGIAALVTIPIFMVLFFRLRRMEQTSPGVHNDSSRRRGVQLALLVSFVWGIKSVIFYLYGLLNPVTRSYGYYGYNVPTPNEGTLQVAALLHLVITLVIAGTIFWYFWKDEHRQHQ